MRLGLACSNLDDRASHLDDGVRHQLRAVGSAGPASPQGKPQDLLLSGNVARMPGDEDQRITVGHARLLALRDDLPGDTHDVRAQVLHGQPPVGAGANGGHGQAAMAPRQKSQPSRLRPEQVVEEAVLVLTAQRHALARIGQRNRAQGPRHRGQGRALPLGVGALEARTLGLNYKRNRRSWRQGRPMRARVGPEAGDIADAPPENTEHKKGRLTESAEEADGTAAAQRRGRILVELARVDDHRIVRAPLHHDRLRAAACC
mmetsp:Transcript_11176/g.32203  ORF Transcript_11176/g.32203 Transcript_11176/m.32203 type:complete len:260 (-) Transcript_11176:1643-2422(-)